MRVFAYAMGVGALIVLVVGKCVPSPTPDTDPTVVIDPPPQQTPCQRACNRLKQLDCPGAAGAPDGTPCWQVCENQEASDFSSFCPEAVAAIHSCNELLDAYASCDN